MLNIIMLFLIVISSNLNKVECKFQILFSLEFLVKSSNLNKVECKWCLRIGVSVWRICVVI